MSIISNFPSKGNNLTGTQKQIIGFDENGKQIAKNLQEVDNSVTIEGKANIIMDESLETNSYTIEMTEEPEGDLSATQVSYNNVATGMTSTNVQDAVTELFTSASEGKSLVAAAITGKGVETAANVTFQQMADNIGAIETGGKTATFSYDEDFSAQEAIYIVNSDGELVNVKNLSVGSKIIIPVPCIMAIYGQEMFNGFYKGNAQSIYNKIYDGMYGYFFEFVYVTGDVSIDVPL